MNRRRSCECDPDDIDTTHLGAATPAAGMPKRVPKKPFPIGFDTNPDHYKPSKQRKRRKRDS